MWDLEKINNSSKFGLSEPNVMWRTHLIDCKFTELSDQYFPKCQSSSESTTVQHNELKMPWKQELQATVSLIFWSKVGSELNPLCWLSCSYIHAVAELSSDLAAGHLLYFRGLSSIFNIVERNFSVIYSVLALKPLPFCTDHRCYIKMMTTFVMARS